MDGLTEAVIDFYMGMVYMLLTGFGLIILVGIIGLIQEYKNRYRRK